MKGSPPGDIHSSVSATCLEICSSYLLTVHQNAKEGTEPSFWHRHRKVNATE